MKDLGDYFYLIVIVIAGLSSLFKNKSKKKVTSPFPESATESDEAYAYEEVPEEEAYEPFQTYQPQVVFEKEIQRTPFTSQETTLTYENTTDFTKLKARKEVTKTSRLNSKNSVEKEILTDTVVDSENNYAINTVNEARAAFIASEIFNRKY